MHLQNCCEIDDLKAAMMRIGQIDLDHLRNHDDPFIAAEYEILESRYHQHCSLINPDGIERERPFATCSGST